MKSKRTNIEKVEEKIDTILNIKLKSMRENETQNIPPVYKLTKFKSESQISSVTM